MTKLQHKAKKGRSKRPIIPIWCKIVDAVQTAAINADSDYELRHLAD